MKKYSITKKNIGGDHWQVWWNGECVYDANSSIAQWTAHTFADGLERGITENKQSLGANSKIKIEGWMDYLETFNSYEEYRDN